MTSRRQQEVADRIRADRRFWRELVAQVPLARMNEPGPMGQWTFRDLVAHLAGWRNVRIPQLEAAASGLPAPAAPWPFDEDDYDAINDWLRERDRDRSTDDVLADYDGSFERLAAAIESLPERLAIDPTAFPFMDGAALVDADFTEHLHEEHLPAIRAWLGRG